METWITSDVHLGARQCRAERFRAFLDKVPPEVRLILNGDVITRRRSEASLPASHKAALDDLRALSLRQEVIWIAGNHDRNVRLGGKHKIQFRREFEIDRILFIAHGDGFDHLSCAFRLITLPIKVMYEFFTRVIGSKTHVAEFAKLFPGMYEILNGHVIRNATQYAREHGYAAVTCGHTHHPGERHENGVTYYNTGCWTEDGNQVLICEGSGLLRLLCADSLGVSLRKRMV
jgi:UDP-2,3-diacylglucosamine pyrophosphatase LpxH